MRRRSRTHKSVFEDVSWERLTVAVTELISVCRLQKDYLRIILKNSGLV